MIEKLLTVLVLYFVCEVSSQAVGESCTQDGITGVCTPLGSCQSAANISKSEWWKLHRCGFQGIEVVICCVEAPTNTSAGSVATTPRPGPNTPILDGCAALEKNRTTEKTGRKAWDKCIDYQHDLVYPCVQTALSGGQGRVNRCGHNVEAPTVGGANAKRFEFPHMVQLSYGEWNGTAQMLCGGTLLSDRFILTAAHCSSERNLGPVTYAISGSLKRTDNVTASQLHRIKRIIRHPQYKPPSKYHDIALLETEQPIKLDFSTVPACLDVFGDDESKAVATGWGVTAPSGGNADILQKVTLSRFKEEECSAKYRPYRFLRNGYNPTTQVCYGDYNEPRDTCHGDSGGPLTVQNHKLHCMYTVIGVTSFGKGCGRVASPGIYTRVSYYVPWIEGIVFA